MAFNYLPVRFTDASFEAGTQPYESPEQLEALRTRLAKTHSVIRLRSQIVCVPVTEDAETIGNPARFDTSGPNLALTAYLLQAELMRVLTGGWNFLLRKFDPLTFVSRLPNRDLMRKALKDRPAIEGLHVYPEYELDVRRSGPMGYAGIIVGLKTRYEISLPVSELIALGVHVVGQYVLTESDSVPKRPFQDPVARRRLDGVVEAVAKDRIVLGTSVGRVEVAASQAWLESRRDNFLAVVQAIAGASATSITDALEYQVFTVTGAEGRMARTQEIADGLIKLGPPEKIWAEPEELLLVCDNIAVYYGVGGAVLTVTAGWTGSRWGELTGLRRPNLHLFDDDTGYFDIDPDRGKTPESARRVQLAPFHVRLLRAYLDTHTEQTVFPAVDGGWQRRSNFSHRAMRPAADGTRPGCRSAIRLEPAKPGLTFHGTRHGHKTWMIADGIPEAAQDQRLGHLMPDKVRQTYSHVAPIVEARLLERLQQRWEKAVLQTNHDLDIVWRSAA